MNAKTDKGGLEKITIEAYTDKALCKPAPSPNRFIIPINPESFARNLKIELENSQGQGTQGNNAKTDKTLPEDLKLDFTLDGTGMVEGYEKSLIDVPVADQIDRFLQVAYRMHGPKHKPHFLKIVWGQHRIFYCQLKTVDINYTLFQPDGMPLRAKLSTTFQQYLDSERRVAEEDKSSPDLTHVLRLEAEQTLPAVARKIYGDDDFYRQVALANGLSSFRNIPVGTELIYPPLQKAPVSE